MRCGSQLTRNREGTLKPLSWSVFEVLKTVRILRRFRGQRGRQLKSSSRFSTSFSSSKFKVSANVVDVHKTLSVSSNIQVHTYDVIMETIPNAVSPYPSTSSSGRSTFESRTINVASTPRSQPSSSSAQRNCTTSKLKIVHLNIRSLRSPSHLTELRDWAAANKTDVITISETWLNTPVTNSEVSIDGYKLYRQDRLRKRGGGVCAYIRKDITVTVLKDISHLSKNYFYQEEINYKLATFNDTFLSTLDANAPIKSIRIRSRPCPYVTPEIKDQMTFRDQPFRLYRQSWYADAWKAYKEARRCIKQLLKNAECDHIRTEVQSHKDNPGSLRKIINSCIPSKEKETPVYSRNTELVADDFNQFFSFVGRNVAQTTAQLTVENNINISDTCLISPPTTRNSSEELFNFNPVTCTQVERIVSSMPSNKSPGPDKVSMRIIKDCLPVIPGPLTDIINCSFATSTFPNSWKASEVIPQGAILSPLLFCIYISDLPLAPQACNL